MKKRLANREKNGVPMPFNTLPDQVREVQKFEARSRFRIIGRKGLRIIQMGLRGAGNMDLCFRVSASDFHCNRQRMQVWCGCAI